MCVGRRIEYRDHLIRCRPTIVPCVTGTSHGEDFLFATSQRHDATAMFCGFQFLQTKQNSQIGFEFFSRFKHDALFYPLVIDIVFTYFSKV